MIEAAIAGLIGLVLVVCIILAIGASIYLLDYNPLLGFLFIAAILFAIITVSVYGKQQQRQEILEACAA